MSYLRRHWLVLGTSLAAALGIVGGLRSSGAAPQVEPTPSAAEQSLSYPIVDTGQIHCFSDRQQLLKAPKNGEPFFGQDCFYAGAQPQYRDNHDGTISDLHTGLMWQKTPAQDRKLTFREIFAEAQQSRLAGYDDWRVPTIKELYSLIDFNGNSRAQPPVAYLDTHYFDFRFGDESAGERRIDAQYWSSTEYVGLTMRGNATVYGVNFADGRIKGYPRDFGRNGAAKFFLRLARGNPEYGKNRFVDNHDGTISDLATGLMWSKTDSGHGLNWQGALAYAERLTLAGHHDWRLPNAKELQSIVDYTRAPDAQNAAQRGPALDPIFKISNDEAWFWSSTTHLEGPGGPGSAVYLAFGRAMGFMPGPNDQKTLLNVHGAGAQRSDPKSGDPKSPQWARGRGPQGDEIRIFNYARAVRNLEPTAIRLVEPDLMPLPPTRLGSPEGPASRPAQPPEAPVRRRLP